VRGNGGNIISQARVSEKKVDKVIAMCCGIKKIRDGCLDLAELHPPSSDTPEVTALRWERFLITSASLVALSLRNALAWPVPH
jgi:hypothetical protein